MAKAFLLLFITLAPSLVFAQRVFINEIAWMGSIIDGVDPSQHWRYEWLELYNASEVPVALEGWTVELSREKIDFKIPLKGSILSKGYFLIGASDKIQGLDLNYKNLVGKFNNSGQKVILKNSAGEVMDEVDATKGWPAGGNKSKQTMERKTGSDPATWQTSKESGGTPKAQNSSGVELKPIAQKLSFPKKPIFNVNEKLGFSAPETKKDISMSSGEESQNIFNSTTLLVALVLALGSSAAILALKKRVLRA